jgi:Flp pilus assembly protein TadG
MRRRARQQVRRRGAVMVETALVLTTLFLLIFMIFEHGRLLMTRQLLQNAAREGARQALSGTNTKIASDITAVVNGYVSGIGLTNVVVQTYATDTTGNNLGNFTNAAFGTKIAVQVDADYHMMLPTFFRPSSNTFPLHVKSTMSSEAN